MPHSTWRARAVSFVAPKMNRSAFNGKEIAVIDSVIAAFWGRSAKEVSEISHRFQGWEYAGDRETIPYATALTSDREPDEDDYAFARELGEQYVAARQQPQG